MLIIPQGSRSKKALLVVSAFLCTFLRVHDFIYGGAGRRAWLIGYRSEKRRIVPFGSLCFGHSDGF